MKVEIEQTGLITKQGNQYLIVIQKENWPKIEKVLGRKLHVKFILEPVQMKIEV